MAALRIVENRSHTTGVCCAYSTIRALPSDYRQGFASASLARVLPSLWLILVSVLLMLPGGCGPAPDPPSLVLVSLDTLRADRLGCYGYQRDTSPNLDRLAGEAVLFEYAVSQANETVRSHRSLFTSIYPTESLARRDRRLMADRLREAGFATGGFTDGGPMGKDFGFHQGFDQFGEWGNGLGMKCRQALEWLDGLPQGRRFFLFVHCFDIHAPYAPPAPWRDHFGKGNPSTIVPKETAEICRRIRGIDSAASGEELRLDQDDRRRLSDLYDGGIRYTDEVLDRFFQDLDTRGLFDNAIVVVFSDHGEEFWDHGSVLHGHTLYQELTHVPLIIRIPGMKARRVPVRVGLIDVLPTIFDLLGVEIPDDAAGTSLLPLIRGEREERDGGPLISEGMEVGHYSVIEDGYKLIRRPDLKRYELYDLRKDIAERDDLSGKQPELVARMNQVMRRHHEALLALPRPGSPKAPRPGEQLGPRTVDRLRELGYLEPDPGEEGSDKKP